MAEQERMKYHRPSERSSGHDYEAKDAIRQQEEDRHKQEAARKAGELAIETSDEILDEIDEILEVNAEELVRTYVQRGGE